MPHLGRQWKQALDLPIMPHSPVIMCNLCLEEQSIRHGVAGAGAVAWHGMAWHGGGRAGGQKKKKSLPALTVERRNLPTCHCLLFLLSL